jgi:hypothetical protein
VFKCCNEKYLAYLLKVDRRYFHRKIKPLIINDFKAELKQKGIENPDIGLDKTGCIYLVDPRNSKVYVDTKLSLDSYN